MFNAVIQKITLAQFFWDTVYIWYIITYGAVHNIFLTQDKASNFVPRVRAYIENGEM